MENSASKPKVVHCKKEKYDVYIGRPSKWGNPIKLEREEDRERVLQEYIDWIVTQPHLIEAARRELRGKILGCWCSPKMCHGDILLEIANS